MSAQLDLWCWVVYNSLLEVGFITGLGLCIEHRTYEYDQVILALVDATMVSFGMTSNCCAGEFVYAISLTPIMACFMMVFNENLQRHSPRYFRIQL